MPIKLIVFDLDGTLVDSRQTHYASLNDALTEVNPKFRISLEEHYSTYDGLPTTKKLEILTQQKGLPRSEHKRVWELKQKFTADLVNEYTEDKDKINLLSRLKELNYLIYVASNCTWKNLMNILYRKGFLPYVDWFISNEDVKHPKPSPEMYMECMIRARVTPKETLVVEDSPIGKKSALDSGAHLLPVVNPSDLYLSKVLEYIKSLKMSTPPVMYRKECNVVIPMAGYGSRFAKAGYTFPKPLIDVKGKAMIEVVVRNLGLDPETSRFIFIVQKEHYETYNLDHLLNKIAPGCKIIQVDGVTEGAMCSVLLAKNHIDNDLPLIIANSDQFVEWDPNSFFYQAESADGGIATFSSSHPKWSYAKLDRDGFVEEVAEKKVISEHATVGIYYFKKGSDLVQFGEEMIARNIRVNNEFYVCPVFNEFIRDGKKIRIVNVTRMWGIGTPEDLEYFLENYKGEV